MTPSPKFPPEVSAPGSGSDSAAGSAGAAGAGDVSPAPLLQRWGFSLAGWADNRRGEWWLLAQLLLIAAHLLPPWPRPGAWGYAWPLPLALAGGLTFGLGLLLAVLALRRLGASLTPLPEPMPAAPLVTSGAYARCRHPLYQAVLLCSLGVTLAFGSVLHLGLLLALALVLAGKARREERALLQRHPEYADYRRRTPAIIPALPGLDWRD